MCVPSCVPTFTRRGGVGNLRLFLLLLAALVATMLVVSLDAAASQASAAERGYLPPVDGPVIDPFRPPRARYGSGNRGLEYSVPPQAPVRAAAAGRVAFAGQVGGVRYVSVDHPDGLRTTYGGLTTIAVRLNERVAQGQAVGGSGTRLHFGVRRGDQYLDPALLLGARSGRAYLVPDRGRREHGVSAAGSTGRPMRHRAPTRAELEWASEEAFDGDGHAVAPVAHRRRRCTPERIRPPTPKRQRMAVLVGGLGSSSTDAAIDDVDTVALGYDPGNTLRFSYAGGRVPGRVGRDLRSIDVHAYDPRHTLGDLHIAGARLSRLLTELAERSAGGDIDLIAHSQGGVVTRLALAELERAHARTTLDRIGTVVTLGSPHQGADLAAMVRRINASPTGRAVLRGVRSFALAAIEPSSPAVRQLAPDSTLVRNLKAQRVPAGIRAVSVAARGDVVVPAPRTRLPGAQNITVTVDGFNDHAELPGSPAAAREIALAVADLPPTCRSMLDSYTGGAVGGLVQLSQDVVQESLTAWLAHDGTRDQLERGERSASRSPTTLG